MPNASSKSYQGWEDTRSQRCKICGAEMVRVMAAYDKTGPSGKKCSEFVEELECSNCGKVAPLSYKNTKRPRKKKRW